MDILSLSYPATYDVKQLMRLMVGVIVVFEMDPDGAGDIVMDLKDPVGR